jgi:polyhydroxyalkanoate synthase
MVAAQHSSTSSRTNTSSDRTQAQAGEQQASANAAGVQQLFDAWLNAWRTLGAPAAASGNPFAMPSMPDFSQAAAGMPQFAEQFAALAKQFGQSPFNAAAGQPIPLWATHSWGSPQWTRPQWPRPLRNRSHSSPI